MAEKECVFEESKGILAISKAINYLGLNIYKQLAKEKKNVFFSPLSLSSALSMLFCGANSKTSEELRRVLGYNEASIKDEDVKHCFHCLHSVLDKSQDSYNLTSANVVFSQNDFQVKQSFKTLLEQSFKAMTLEVDFRNDSVKAVQQANNWVNEKTNGMIPKILDSLNPATVMVILNAVYFKGFWMHPFKKHSTELRNFYNNGLKGNVKQVDMMHMTEDFLFIKRKSFKALQLPYKGDEISMMILLPDSRNGLKDLEKKIKFGVIEDLQTHMFKQKVIVALPKFRLEYSKLMKEPFQALGMSRVFCPGAHLENISDSKKLLVSEISHKAVLVMNEEGSEAAAATAVYFVECCLRSDPEFIILTGSGEEDINKRIGVYLSGAGDRFGGRKEGTNIS